MSLVKKDKRTGDAIGTGRRKSSVARVRLREGSGKIVINQKPIEEFFPNVQDRKAVIQTLEAVERTDSLDVLVTVKGGGTTGQAGACRMGLARALISYDLSLIHI